jgi:transcriptional regulator with XRE-family HTH domain
MKTRLDATFRLSMASRRIALGLSQRDLAAQLGTVQSAVSELENGKYDPRLSTLNRWADSLGMKLTLRLQERPGGEQRG